MEKLDLLMWYSSFAGKNNTTCCFFLISWFEYEGTFMAGGSGACPSRSERGREQAFFNGGKSIFLAIVFSSWIHPYTMHGRCKIYTENIILWHASFYQELKSVTSQSEAQKTRIEMAAMKRDAEHYSRQVALFYLPKIHDLFLKEWFHQSNDGWWFLFLKV